MESRSAGRLMDEQAAGAPAPGVVDDEQLAAVAVSPEAVVVVEPTTVPNEPTAEVMATLDEPSFVELTSEQADDLETRLGEYDSGFYDIETEGSIELGVLRDGRLVGGARAEMSEYRIMYLSTLFVDADYRRHGIGRRLIAEVESRARLLGAKIIRLDTFSWQGVEFYRSIGYLEAGRADYDGVSEHFFYKRLD